MEYEYKVIDVADGAVSSLLLNEGRIETDVLQAYLNAMAADAGEALGLEGGLFSGPGLDGLQQGDLPPEKWTGLSRSAFCLGGADIAQ